MSNQIEVIEGSGNVFADLGLPQPEERLLKAEIALNIRHLLQAKGLTQKQAAALLKIDQPKISALLHGRLSGFSLERLLRYLNALDRDVQIVITDRAPTHEKATVRVVSV